ncbi:hypothetical protein ACFO4E_10890 [Nocardiopsis mangrovi]|uniref:Uncharacterized protein n=1 Tax=Nocardiopsis mangrovi TaxID=1179818 RepID=A0ABV9DVD1_9ACTN
MGKHDKPDTPPDTGRGGDSDGQQGTKHGSEGIPPQSGDGQGGTPST